MQNPFTDVSNIMDPNVQYYMSLSQTDCSKLAHPETSLDNHKSCVFV